MNISIRKVKIDDASKILDIYSKHINDTIVTFETTVPSITEFEERIKTISKTYPYLVCTNDNELVGYAYATKYREREAYKYSVEIAIYVSENFQKKGVGKLLLANLLDELKANNFCSVYSCISVPNEPSVKLHEHFGFTEIGVFHNAGRKFDKWIDVVWLEKCLL